MDGREISLEEFPLAHRLRTYTALRAEEVVLKAPDGRSVTVLGQRYLHLFGGWQRDGVGFGRNPADESANLNPAETRQFHTIINDQADRMRAMITDLLDAAQIESGTLSVSLEPSEVVALVDQARTSFVRGGGPQRTPGGCAGGSSAVMADRARITQVINNLLSNASRYAPVSSVIGVTAQHEGNSRGPRRQRIWAESDGLDSGIRFTFTIPVAERSIQAEPTNSDRPDSRSHPRDIDAGRVLVVDDDPQTLRHVRDILAKDRYLTIFATGPDEALHLVESETPNSPS
ncbi:hypothetical protein GBAR_LOCUS31208 [Geodia barretti]|uniref:histidine kinase n=1 Tax=Geodia barretti TaxID=519541 RepID=A0AA35TZ95_GEOBA|nr:hypothetical protein GBAR_LOCUS31208 [Geodia barretti]